MASLLSAIAENNNIIVIDINGNIKTITDYSELLPGEVVLTKGDDPILSDVAIKAEIVDENGDINPLNIDDEIAQIFGQLESGQDPTQLGDEFAPAAGQAQGSSAAPMTVIERDGTETIASTSFDTTGLEAQGLSETQSLAIFQQFINDAPTVTLTNIVLDIDENTDTTNSIKIADITINDDEQGTNELALTGTDTDKFEIVTVGDNYELHLKAGEVLDHETLANLDVNVTVDDPTVGTGVDDSASTTLGVNDLNEAPTAISLSNQSVDENAAGAVIGSLSTADVDDGDSHSYSVSDDRFEVVNGELKLKDGESLDHESEDSVSVTVTSTDSGNLSTQETFSITVNDVDESGSFDAQTVTYAENQVADAVVGSVSGSDLDGVSNYQFKDSNDNLSNTSQDGFYTIDTNGDIRITAAGVAAEVNDFEQGDNSGDYQVVMTDGYGSTAEATVTLKETNVNDAPTLDLNGVTSDIIFEGSYAGFNNAIGVYTLDENGNPTDPILISDGAHGETIGDKIAELNIPADEIHFFIVANGNTQLNGIDNDQLSFDNSGSYPKLIIENENGSTSQVTKPIYFDEPSLNQDGKDHFIEVQNEDGTSTSIGIEDLYHLGDKDFQDVMLRVEERDAGIDYQTTFTEGGSGVSIVDTDISIDDVDGSTLESATVTLTNHHSGDVLIIGDLPDTIIAKVGDMVVTGSVDAGSVITLEGIASHDDYEAALKAITFESTSVNPDTEDRQIEITIDDGNDENATATATSVIKVIEVNDAPEAENFTVEVNSFNPTSIQFESDSSSSDHISDEEDDSAHIPLKIVITELPEDGTLYSNGQEILAEHIANGVEFDSDSITYEANDDTAGFLLGSKETLDSHGSPSTTTFTNWGVSSEGSDTNGVEIASDTRIVYLENGSQITIESSEGNLAQYNANSNHIGHGIGNGIEKGEFITVDLSDNPVKSMNIGLDGLGGYFDAEDGKEPGDTVWNSAEIRITYTNDLGQVTEETLNVNKLENSGNSSLTREVTIPESEHGSITKVEFTTETHGNWELRYIEVNPVDDSFKYEAVDSDGLTSDEKQVSISNVQTLEPSANDIPVFKDESDSEVTSYNFNYDEDQREDAVIGSVHATDANDDNLSYAITGGNANGWFEINPDNGDISLTSEGVDSVANDFDDAQSNNNHQLTVSVDDGKGGIRQITVNLSEQNVNEAPTTADGVDLGTTQEDTPVAINIQALLSASTDLDGDTIYLSTLTVDEQYGTLDLVTDSDGNITSATFNPKADFGGNPENVNLSYSVNDGIATSDVATATLGVIAVADKPNLTVMVGEPSLVAGSEGVETDIDTLVNSGYTLKEGQNNKGNEWETVSGNNGSDVLSGGNGKDYLYGNEGNDALFGGNATDKLYGGEGSDTLVGGNGKDYLDGGAGTDTAVFSGSFEQAKITSISGGYTVKNGSDATDTLVNIERLQFDDGVYVLDNGNWVKEAGSESYYLYPVTIDAYAIDNDHSESITEVSVSGLPSGATLSSGTENADGSWVLTSEQLSGLEMTVPADAADFQLTVTAVSGEASNNSTAQTTVVESVEVNTAPIVESIVQGEVFQSEAPMTRISIVLDTSGSMHLVKDGTTRMLISLEATKALLNDIKDQEGSESVYIQLSEFNSFGQSKGWFTLDAAIDFLIPSNFSSANNGTDYEKGASSAINGYDLLNTPNQLPEGLSNGDANDVVYFISDGQNNGGWYYEISREWQDFVEDKLVYAVGVGTTESSAADTSLKNISSNVKHVADEALKYELKKLAPQYSMTGLLLLAATDLEADTLSVSIDVDSVDLINTVVPSGKLVSDTWAVSKEIVDGEIKLTTEFGDLFINQDGSYRFLSNPEADLKPESGEAIGLQFVYTIEDTNGAQTQNVLSLTISPEGESNTVITNTFDGDSSDNIISGTDQDDVILGYAGDDVLIGNDGDDYIIGGAGNDVIDGGLGNDILVGGDGQDIFQWTTESVGTDAVDVGTDVIKDFHIHADKIDLSELLQDDPTTTGVDHLLDISMSGDDINIDITVDSTHHQIITLEGAASDFASDYSMTGDSINITDHLVSDLFIVKHD